MRRALLGLALAACGDDRAAAPSEWIAVTAVPAVPSRELDLLILVDNSNSTLEYQGGLAAAMPTLVDALDALDGGRPSLHVGVASSDLGTTGSLDYQHPAPAIGSGGVGTCSDYGDDGVLQLGLATLVAGTYLVDEVAAGARVTNYGAVGLAAALGQMVMLGAEGCEFEQQLAGIRRALSTPLNRGFLRPTANLAVLLIGDEDDCSVRDAGFFTPDSAELGPLQSFRCVSQGIVCDEGLDTVGAKSNCRSRADARYIEDVQPFADFLLGLKAHPQQLAVAAIVGPAAPMGLELRSPPGGGTAVLAVQHSCRPTDGSVNVADPGVRVADWLTRLPRTPTALIPICQRDLTPAVTALGQIITRSMHGDACIDTSALLDTASEPGFQLDCEVVDIGDATPELEVPIAACDATTPTDCFAIVTDAARCPHTPDHLRVELRRSQPGIAGTWSHLRCRAR